MSDCQEIYQLHTHCLSPTNEVLVPPCIQIVCEKSMDSEDWSIGLWIFLGFVITIVTSALLYAGFYIGKKKIDQPDTMYL